MDADRCFRSTLLRAIRFRRAKNPDDAVTYRPDLTFTVRTDVGRPCVFPYEKRLEGYLTVNGKPSKETFNSREKFDAKVEH
ncbi:MAG TPA: hypothetical protein VJ734_09205, partial [Nitrosospira sp.]|nr:hypothetical protein [Nitrosospira sp.]